MNMSLTQIKIPKTKHFALLVVDMLNDFVYGAMKCPNAKKILPKIKSLIKTMRENNIPVFYCNDAHLPNDDYEFKLWGPHALKGSYGAKVINELKPSGVDYMVPKRTYSAFYNTKLDSLLKKEFCKKSLGVLIISGIHTDICAKHTVFDAFIRGYDVLVAKDGVTSFSEKDHKSALEYMKKNYGAKILKTSEIIELVKEQTQIHIERKD